MAAATPIRLNGQTEQHWVGPAIATAKQPSRQSYGDMVSNVQATDCEPRPPVTMVAYSFCPS